MDNRLHALFRQLQVNFTNDCHSEHDVHPTVRDVAPAGEGGDGSYEGPIPFLFFYQVLKIRG